MRTRDDTTATEHSRLAKSICRWWQTIFSISHTWTCCWGLKIFHMKNSNYKSSLLCWVSWLWTLSIFSLLNKLCWYRITKISAGKNPESCCTPTHDISVASDGNLPLQKVFVLFVKIRCKMTSMITSQPLRKSSNATCYKRNDWIPQQPAICEGWKRFMTK